MSFHVAVPVDAVVPLRRVPSVPVDAHQRPECINKVARSQVLGFAFLGVQPVVTQRPRSA